MPSEHTNQICKPVPHFRSTISRIDSRLVALAKLPELRGTCSEVIGLSLTSNRFRYFAPVGTPADAVIAVKLTADFHTSGED